MNLLGEYVLQKHQGFFLADVGLCHTPDEICSWVWRRIYCSFGLCLYWVEEEGGSGTQVTLWLSADEIQWKRCLLVVNIWGFLLAIWLICWIILWHRLGCSRLRINSCGIGIATKFGNRLFCFSLCSETYSQKYAPGICFFKYPEGKSLTKVSTEGRYTKHRTSLRLEQIYMQTNTSGWIFKHWRSSGKGNSVSLEAYPNTTHISNLCTQSAATTRRRKHKNNRRVFFFANKQIT